MSLDRLKDALGRFIESRDPRRDYRAIYEYTVVASTPGASSAGVATAAVASLRPTDDSMPELVGVPVYMPVTFAGTGALSLTLTPGSTVYVAFANADPSKPFAVAHIVPQVAPP